MDNNTKILLGVVTIAIGGTATYFIVKNKKKRDLEKSLETQLPKNSKKSLTDNKSTAPGPGVPKAKWMPEKFPLVKGMQGNGIKMVQTILNKLFKKNLEVDGKFGNKTEAALYTAIGKKIVTQQDFMKYQKYGR